MAVVAVFGGSFSPVHRGHMEVARGVLEKGLADEVWLTPCRRNPLKDGSTTMPDSLRLKLLQSAADYFNRLADAEKIKICRIELDMPSPSYTCETLKALQRTFPQHRFRLLAGADSYNDFDRWREAEWIERNFDPIVYPRPGFELRKDRGGWTRLEGVEEFDVSSTEIRESGFDDCRSREMMPWITNLENLI